MSEADWVAKCNVAAGGPARAGMTTAQRNAHARLASILPKRVYERPETSGRDPKPSEQAAKAARVAAAAPSRHRGVAVDLRGNVMRGRT